MAAVDMARNSRYYSDADIDSPPAESPERPVMNGTTDHLGPQFLSIRHEHAGQPADRHAQRIGDQTLYEWQTSPAAETMTRE